jgi:hypothetical protein
LRRGTEHFSCTWGLYSLYILLGDRAIQSTIEPLRTHPRRSERVSEVCSPLILKLVSRLVSLTLLMNNYVTPLLSVEVTL